MKLVIILLAIAGLGYCGYQAYQIGEPIYKSYTPESTIAITQLFEFLKWFAGAGLALIILLAALAKMK